MKFKIGDKLLSKINKTFDGYYEVIAISNRHYVLKSIDDTEYSFVYTKTIKWTEKNMRNK